MDLFEAKCLSDRRMVERVMNATILPALASLGIIPEGLSFAYQLEEDREALWQRTLALMPYYNMDEEWLRNTFGVAITDAKSTLAMSQLSAKLSAKPQVPYSSAEYDFFD